MSDDKVRTRVWTDVGVLDFQDYFVRRRCAPVVCRLEYEGASAARPHDVAMTALAHPHLRAVVICPSNPLLSIEPMLALPRLREAIAACPAPVVGVSPIIAGAAVKGPTAKMMTELGLPVTATAVARRYSDLLDGYVVDAADASQAQELDLPVMVTSTLMVSLADREALARDVLGHADRLAKAPA
jgi:LPPG:FO 2-phospho-L-lactate transferase